MFRRAPAWFWVAIALGAAIRFYLVVFTQGTADVANWEAHARGVHELGFLVGAGRCYEPHQTTPYFPFLEALRMTYTACLSALRNQETFEENVGGLSPAVAKLDGFTGFLS